MQVKIQNNDNNDHIGSKFREYVNQVDSNDIAHPHALN